LREPATELQIPLASGLTWGIRARGLRAHLALRGLAETACLQPLVGTPDLMLLVRDPSSGRTRGDPDVSATCDLIDEHAAGIARDMARACSVLAAHTPGALLLHSALVARDGRAVLLAGPGGRGKSTTSKRLPSPWQALSDDTALVVAAPAGGHAVHPWPTWSRLLWEDSTETWDVQRSFPLEHIFFLSWSDHDAFEPVGHARALCFLIESAEQARGYLPAESISAARRKEGLESAVKLVRSVPVSILHISPSGPFWLVIEEALASRQARP
jgi:hypothetical protein